MDGQLSFATLDYAGKKKRTKRDANGGWCIDPAEFHRTFPPLVMAGAEQPPKQQDATDASSMGELLACPRLKRRLEHLGHLERFRVPAAPIAVPKRSSVYPTVELAGRQPKRR